MKLSLKIGLVMLTVLMLISMATIPTLAAADTSIIDDIKDEADNAKIDSTDMAVTAGKILRLIRTMALILGTIIIAILGVKYMLGSVEEKAEYKKSFVPLIVGIVVVMAATSIASLLFDIF